MYADSVILVNVRINVLKDKLQRWHEVLEKHRLKINKLKWNYF